MRFAKVRELPKVTGLLRGNPDAPCELTVQLLDSHPGILGTVQ